MTAFITPNKEVIHAGIGEAFCFNAVTRLHYSQPIMK